MRRGLIDAIARPGSTGFRAIDILADAPQNMTNVARLGGNANAHRAIVRGSVIVLAYDQTPNMDAADPEKTAHPTTNYNLFVTRSTAGWAAWQLECPVEPVAHRLTRHDRGRTAHRADTRDDREPADRHPGCWRHAGHECVLCCIRDRNATRSCGRAGRVYVSRTTDQGASFEPFVPVSSEPAGQSESQLRPMPDGSSSMVLWMAEQTIGDPTSKDAMFAMAHAIQLPDLKVSAADASFPAFSQFTVNLAVLNRGTGHASKVSIGGTLPDGLSPVGIGDPSICRINGSKFECAIPTIAASAGRVMSLTVTGGTGGHIHRQCQRDERGTRCRGSRQQPGIHAERHAAAFFVAAGADTATDTAPDTTADATASNDTPRCSDAGTGFSVQRWRWWMHGGERRRDVRSDPGVAGGARLRGAGTQAQGRVLTRRAAPMGLRLIKAFRRSAASLKQKAFVCRMNGEHSSMWRTQ